MIQLTFFEETREEKLEKKIAALQISCDKMRRSQFAKISEIKAVVTGLSHELEILKIAICKPKE